MLKITSKGQGMPLVLIHGWGLNSGIWQPLVDLLAIDFQVITVDLPGFGLNVEKSIKPYTVKSICQHISLVIEQPAIYIGWSLGGLVATEMALNYADKVLALVTVASSPCFVEQNEQSEQGKWPGIKPGVLSLFHQQLAQDTKKTIDGFLKIQAMGSPHIRQDLKQIKQLIMQYPLPSQVTLEESLSLLSSSDYRQQLCLLTLPFLRLYGRLDSLVPKTAVAKISQLTKQSDEFIFPQASHAPFISHLDDFYQVLKSWLDKQFNHH